MSNLAAQELQSFVRRIENLDDEIRVLNADKSEVFKEVKGAGFTAKTLRRVVAARRMDATERDDADAEFELYWNAVHGIDPEPVRAHVENIEEFPAHDADGVVLDDEPQSPVTAAQMHSQTGSVGGSSLGPVTSLDRAEGIANGQLIQPETANGSEAQKVERRSPKPEAAGSTPATLANSNLVGSAA